MIESHTTTASDADAGIQHFATAATQDRATATTYRAVMLTRKSTSLDVLQIVELPIVAPGPGQLRVRVRAVGVGATDLMMLGGYRARRFLLPATRSSLFNARANRSREASRSNDSTLVDQPGLARN
jgi:hypothetical protein